MPRSTSSSACTWMSTTSHPRSAREGAIAPDALRDGARIEIGLRGLPRGGSVHGVQYDVRGPPWPDPAPGPGGPAAHAGWVRVRRRRRLEDRRDGPRDEGDDQRTTRWRLVHGGLHLPPGRERGPEPRGAHAGGLRVDRRRAPIARDPSPVDRRQGGPGPAHLRRPSGPRGHRVASPTWASASGCSPRWWTSWNRPHSLPRLPVARALWRPRPDLKTNAAAWIYAGGSHHTSLGFAVTPEHLTDFAAMSGTEFVLIDETTQLDRFRDQLRWNDLYYLLARAL